MNDRSQPRRPFAAQPAASDIDNALLSYSLTHELFYEVEIEPASWEDRKPVKPHLPHVSAAKRHVVVPPGWARGGEGVRMNGTRAK